MKQIEYKISGKFNQEIIDEILKVEQDKGLTAESLLEEANKKSNPLHALFEWDDKEAGHLFRLQQARMIINEVKVIIESKEYYSKIRVCKLCHLEYGLDLIKEKENLICPRCCITPNKYFFD